VVPGDRHDDDPKADHGGAHEAHSSITWMLEYPEEDSGCGVQALGTFLRYRPADDEHGEIGLEPVDVDLSPFHKRDHQANAQASVAYPHEPGMEDWGDYMIDPFPSRAFFPDLVHCLSVMTPATPPPTALEARWCDRLPAGPGLPDLQALIQGLALPEMSPNLGLAYADPDGGDPVIVFIEQENLFSTIQLSGINQPDGAEDIWEVDLRADPLNGTHTLHLTGYVWMSETSFHATVEDGPEGPAHRLVTFPGWHVRFDATFEFTYDPTANFTLGFPFPTRVHDWRMVEVLVEPGEFADVATPEVTVEPWPEGSDGLPLPGIVGDDVLREDLGVLLTSNIRGRLELAFSLSEEMLGDQLEDYLFELHPTFFAARDDERRIETMNATEATVQWLDAGCEDADGRLGLDAVITTSFEPRRTKNEHIVHGAYDRFNLSNTVAADICEAVDLGTFPADSPTAALSWPTDASMEDPAGLPTTRLHTTERSTLTALISDFVDGYLDWALSADFAGADHCLDASLQLQAACNDSSTPGFACPVNSLLFFGDCVAAARPAWQVDSDLDDLPGVDIQVPGPGSVRVCAALTAIDRTDASTREAQTKCAASSQAACTHRAPFFSHHEGRGEVSWHGSECAITDLDLHLELTFNVVVNATGPASCPDPALAADRGALAPPPPQNVFAPSVWTGDPAWLAAGNLLFATAWIEADAAAPIGLTWDYRIPFRLHEEHDQLSSMDPLVDVAGLGWWRQEWWHRAMLRPIDLFQLALFDLTNSDNLRDATVNRSEVKVSMGVGAVAFSDVDVDLIVVPFIPLNFLVGGIELLPGFGPTAVFTGILTQVLEDVLATTLMGSGGLGGDFLPESFSLDRLPLPSLPQALLEQVRLVQVPGAASPATQTVLDMFVGGLDADPTLLSSMFGRYGGEPNHAGAQLQAGFDQSDAMFNAFPEQGRVFFPNVVVGTYQRLLSDLGFDRAMWPLRTAVFRAMMDGRCATLGQPGAGTCSGEGRHLIAPVGGVPMGGPTMEGLWYFLSEDAYPPDPWRPGDR